MGNNLFGANISGQLAAAMGAGMAPITITRNVSTGINPLDPAAGSGLTQLTFTGRGFMDSKLKALLDSAIGFGGGRRIGQGTGKISIFGDTIKPATAPLPNDQIVIYGALYSVIAVGSDPDAALYECSVRGGA